MDGKLIVNGSRRRRSTFFGPRLAFLAVGIALLAGCSSSTAFKLADSLPGSNSIPGWTPAGKVQTYTRATLFDYIDGASEYFFTYTFEEVAVSRFEKTDGAKLNVEVWQLTAAEDAYGLFSGRTGGAAVSIGGANEAELETGNRLVFWQSRFYVSITAFETIPDDDLRLFAEFISKKLPTGGERPQLVGRLPADGLIPGSVKFFHQELAIQDQLWLGGENVLGLGTDTDAVFARYKMGDAEWQLLLVQYPDTSQADAGLQILLKGGVEGVAATDLNGALLGVIFGQNGGSSAEALLAKALGK